MARRDASVGRDRPGLDDSQLLGATASIAHSIGVSAESWPLGVTVLHSPDGDLRDCGLELRPGLCIGRSTGPGTRAIRDPRISRKHVRFEPVEGADAYEVVDLGSRNGIAVDGRPVARQRLHDGAIIRLGDTLLEYGRLRPTHAQTDDAAALIGGRADLELAAQSGLPVLLMGEPGSGKSFLAEQIHQRSGRAGRFVAINCGAIPAELVESYFFGHTKGAFTGATSDAIGVFEEAAGGTLFLDEVGALELRQQPKLLRVLEQREFAPIGDTRTRKTDARIISATNANLQAEVFHGTFRHDLLTRLAGLVIHVRPLRDRRADIPRLARRFLSEVRPEREFRWTPGFIETLLLQDWPGNARELRFLMERLAHTPEDKLSSRHLNGLLPDAMPSQPPHQRRGTPLARRAADGQTSPSTGRPAASELIGRLTAERGNVRRVARSFGKDSRQIYRWMKAYDLDPDDFRTPDVS